MKRLFELKIVRRVENSIRQRVISECENFHFKCPSEGENICEARCKKGEFLHLDFDYPIFNIYVFCNSSTNTPYYYIYADTQPRVLDFPLICSNRGF